jgi:uncharacterized protein YcbK (DUF882 family)
MATLQFTKNISLYDLTTTDTKLDNNCTMADIPNIQRCALEFVAPLKDKYGASSIIVTSCFRTTAVNSAVGGVCRSDHITGSAVDIVFKNVDFDAAVTWIQDNLKYRFMKVYKGNRIHISLT